MALAATGLTLLCTSGESVVRALPPPSSVDTDGDFLPDDIEWVLLTDPTLADSDTDGVDDFQSVVRHIYPDPLEEPLGGAGTTGTGTGGTSSAGLSASGGVTPPPDHKARLVVSSRADQDGTPAVWVHVLFEFATTSAPPLQAFDVWIDYYGWRASIASALSGPQTEYATTTATSGNCLARLSFRLADEAALLPFDPLTIGAEINAQGASLATGVMLSSYAGVITALTPISSASLVAVYLNSNTGQNPFWSSERVCSMALSVVAGAPSGSLCEVVTSRCRQAGQLRCPPSCSSSTGRLIYVPNGLSLLTGGG